MYKWKINMIDGRSYIVKSTIDNSEVFINELFGVNFGYSPKINIVHYDLYEPKEENTKIAIISNHVSSVEWY